MKRRRKRRIRPVIKVFSALLLICAASLGALWAFAGSGDIPEIVAAATPAPLSVNQTPSADGDVVDAGLEVHNEIENPNPDAIFVEYDHLPWNLTLVNRYNVLPPDFEPYLSSIGGGHYFDARAADSLVAMLNSARSQGLAPLVVSSHRSIERQTTLFENQLNRRLADGFEYDEAFDLARRVVAYPGESEHNLGLAVDIVADDFRNLTAGFGETPEGIWLAENSHRYGFVLRYPDHKQDITNIIYEPWHFRYVGVPHAAIMFENDLVLEEYLELLVFDNE